MCGTRVPKGSLTRGATFQRSFLLVMMRFRALAAFSLLQSQRVCVYGRSIGL